MPSYGQWKRRAPSLPGYFSSTSSQLRRKTGREFQVFFAEELAFGMRMPVVAWPIPAGQAEPQQPDDKSAAGDSEFTCSECSGDLVLDHRTGTTGVDSAVSVESNLSSLPV